MTVDSRGPSVAAHPLPPAFLDSLAGRVRSTGNAAVPVEEVFTGRALVELPQARDRDAAEFVWRARRAQHRWATATFRDRAEIVSKCLALVRDNRNTMLDLIQAETGKGRWEAFIELLEPNLTLSYYLRHGAKLLSPGRREAMVPLLVKTTQVHHPVGVVGVIAPWNFPYALGISDSLTALLAGNAVVLKPDPQTSLNALYLASLLEQAGLPPDVFQVLVGPGSVGAALVDQVDYVAFTGSAATGREVARRAGGRLIGVSLELGGKNAMIVLDDADLESVAHDALRACFMNAGEVCMAIEKIFVPRKSLRQFIDVFAAATDDLKYANSYSYDGTFGSLTNAAQLAKVDGLVQRAVAQGARVVRGGKPRPDIGPYYYEPTILTDVTFEMDLYLQEVFGPVVAVFAYDTVDEAVALANHGEFGLNASVYGRNTKRAAEIATRIRAGTVNVNEGFAAAYGSIGASSGGMGNSGVGRRHGPEGLLKYTEPQTVAVQYLALTDPPAWMPLEIITAVASRAYGLLNRLGIR
jgi:succinate-semialdehyde dehydrogenase / glutarate-semialdehyde dehydrogenase